MKHINRTYDCYEIGKIKTGDSKISFEGHLNWV